ncbi:MAG: HNH endonuclease [Balneolaceae bacterium]|nr:HNH endonuclease [Balneolaceae bacterium]
MNRKEIIEKFQTLTVWQNGDQRAPHKPLLVLLALSYLQNKDQRLLAYPSIEGKLEELLLEFGTPRNASNTHYPFWRLQNEGIWGVERAEELIVNASGDVKKTDLREKNISAGFTKEVYAILKNDTALASEIGMNILASHFPDTIHEDIIHETGFNPSGLQITKQKRDPDFRRKVLQAYEHRCAVCNFDVRMGAKTLCIEAAHIKWHSAGGPDTVNNGIALCTLHHKLFDLGAFTLDKNRQFLVSEKVVGTDGFDLWLVKYHGEVITKPVRSVYEPSVKYIAWNQDQVFKMPGREL